MVKPDGVSPHSTPSSSRASSPTKKILTDLGDYPAITSMDIKLDAILDLLKELVKTRASTARVTPLKAFLAACCTKGATKDMVGKSAHKGINSLGEGSRSSSSSVHRTGAPQGKPKRRAKPCYTCGSR